MSILQYFKSKSNAEDIEKQNIVARFLVFHACDNTCTGISIFIPPGFYLLYEVLINASSSSMFILSTSFESGFAKVQQHQCFQFYGIY